MSILTMLMVRSMSCILLPVQLTGGVATPTPTHLGAGVEVRGQPYITTKLLPSARQTNIYMGNIMRNIYLEIF